MKKIIYIIFLSITLFFVSASFQINEVHAETNEAPVIQLIGSGTIYLEKGTPYFEYGANATDLEDGNITSNIVIDRSMLDVFTIGYQTVTYTVTDSSGNTAQTTRHIVVYEHVSQPLAITNDQTSPWIETLSDGVVTYQSTNKTANSVSGIELSIAGPASLSFEWKVDSEENYDYLSFYVNGSTYGEAISGYKDWQEVTLNLGEGEHLLEWIYSKDGSEDNGSDAGWVRNIKLNENFDPVNIHGLEDKSILIGESFDFREGISFTNQLGETLTYTITSIEGSVDTSMVGYHNLVYNITVMDGELFYNLRLQRTITVLPKVIGISDGESYDGSIILDIEGGSFTINDTPYSQNDEYNIPGESLLIISGINGYTKEINFTVNLTLSGVVHNRTYVYPVTPVFSGGTATLNGNPFISGTEITEIGNHELIINGANGFTQTITFSLVPTLFGLADGGVYYETVTPNINAEHMTLNGVAYQNEPITNAGNYTLIITGAGNYTQEVNFVIETTVNGVIDGGTYLESVTPIISKGSCLLNEQAYTCGDEISTPGLNTLKIVGENGYEKTMIFTIELGVYSLVDNHVYVGSVTPIISGGNITLNGMNYTSGTEITTPGFYTMEISGAPGFLETYTFTVEPTQINVTDGTTYYEPIIPAISGGTLTLNDQPYESGTIINNSGSYTLKIVGEGNYASVYSFTIAPGTNIINGEDYIREVEIIFIGEATLNGQPITSGTIIDTIGSYELIITDGMFNETYQFDIVPDLSDFNSDIFLNYTINIPNTTLTLDGNVIDNNYSINEVGNYTLVIDGVNGYQEVVYFTVKPIVNINHGEDYTTSVVVTAEGGTITLDGEPFVNNTEVIEVGTHTLQITGANGYTNEIIFYVLPGISNVEDGAVYDTSITPTIDSNNLLLNGEVYTSGTEITRLGLNTITITGVNGFNRNISFYLIPSDLEVVEGGIYEGSIIINHETLSLLIDGQPYTSGTEYSSLGLHTLTLVDELGNQHDIHFTIIPNMENITDGGVYYGSVTPIINWTPLDLNGQPYTSGTVINQVGVHTLTILNIDGYDHTITFTVVEAFNNVTDNGVYEGSVTPVVEGTQNLLLNGETYVSGTTITMAGHYTLQVVGLNGYTNTITFTINPSIAGVTDGGLYTSSVLPVINNVKSLELNGLPYTSGTSLVEVGYYTLTIYGLNGYEKTIEFTILENSNITNGEEFLGNVTPTISNATLTLNGDVFISGTTLDLVGNYTLVINGVGGYEKTIEFTILPTILGVSDTLTYEQSVTPNIAKADLYLNGTLYENMTPITEVGHHTLVIEGINGYSDTITFTVTEKITGLDNFATYQRYVTLDTFNSIDFLLNDELMSLSNNSTMVINTVGNNILTIKGLNGYTSTYEFTITEYITGVTDGASYTSGVMPYVDNVNNISLNDKSFINGSMINQVGHHILTIYGVNGYTSQVNFTVEANILDIINEGVYEGVVTPTIENATLLLNSQPFTYGEAIRQVGNHLLEVTGPNGYSVTINFTVTEVLNDVLDEGVYHYSVTPDIPNATLLLNGEPYENLSKIEAVGYHELKISGQGGYEKIIHFTVLERIEGITDLGEYVGRVTPNIPYATLLLDGVEIENLTEIVSVGNHELLITGEGGYTNTITFTVKEELYNFIDGETYQYVAKPTIPNTTLKIDGEIYESGTDYHIVGHHTLEVIGTNGYTQQYTFTITEKLFGFENDQTYNHAITPIIEHVQSVKVNNVLYDGSLIDKMGNYTVVVYGTNGYTNTYQFTIVSNVENVEKNGTYYGDIVPNVITNYAELILNGEAYVNGTPITDVGIHILEVVGENYTDTYTFTIAPMVSNLEDNQTYTGSVIPIIDTTNVYLDGSLERYVSNTPIYEVGNHTLEIKGTNGYSISYSFTIKEATNIIDYADYEGGTRVEIENATLLLNEQAYISGTLIDEIGYYTLEIIGSNGYTNTLHFTVTPLFENFEPNGIYTEVVEPIIIGTGAFKLNGEVFESGTEIYDVGHHILEIIGINGYHKEVQFTLMPKVSGVKSGGTYYDSTSIKLENILNVELDGEPYVLETPIISVGNHSVKIYGINGYVQTIDFLIKEHVEGVSKNQTYNHDVTINVSNIKFATLNGEYYENGTTLSEAGNYSLVVYGENDYTNIITFTIEGQSNINSNEEFIGVVTPTTSNGTLQINGEAHANGAPFREVGNHVLTIVGENGYQKDIPFTIHPIIEDIENGGEYDGSIYISIQNVDLMLDGERISNSSIIKTVGHHTLTLVGEGGYEQTIFFTVKPSLLNIKNDGIYTVIKINIPGALLEIDGETYVKNTLYKEIGHHTLSIIGSNGFTKELQFTIKEDGVNIKDNGIYNNSFTPQINNCKLKLNGEFVESGQPITEIGNHELTVVGSNGYTKTYYFTIIFKEQLVDQGVYEEPVMIKKLNAVMYLDGVEILEDTLIGEKGKHILEIHGAGDYVQTIEFEYDNYNYDRVIILVIPFIVLFGITLYFFIARKKVI